MRSAIQVITLFALCALLQAAPQPPGRAETTAATPLSADALPKVDLPKLLQREKGVKVFALADDLAAVKDAVIKRVEVLSDRMVVTFDNKTGAPVKPRYMFSV